MLTLLMLLKIDSATINLLGAALGTVWGYRICMLYHHIIPVFSASLVGAFFILKGIDTHYGHYPSDQNLPQSKNEIFIFLLYLIALVFFSAGGAYFQLYGCKQTVKPKSVEEPDEDDFKEIK